MMPDRSEHLAKCACGALRLRASGNPDVISVCNCTQCQRRTGSAFGVGVYYPRERILSIEGDFKTFARTVESGRAVTNHFCPNCGTTVYWTLDLRPHQIGVALGCLEDAGVLRPARVVWAQHRHEWVHFAEDLPLFPAGAT